MSILGLFKQKKQKPEPLVIHDELGTFVLERPGKDRAYEGRIQWLDMEPVVSLAIDSEETMTADTALETLHRLAADAAGWDKRIREYAADDMADSSGLIETWEDDGDGGFPTITKEAFIRRISIGFIHIHSDGSLFFDYDLDGMFTDHGLGIHADLSGVIQSSAIYG